MKRISLILGLTSMLALLIVCTPDAKTSDDKKSETPAVTQQEKAQTAEASNEANLSAAAEEPEASEPIAMAPPKPVAPAMPDLPPDGSGKPIEGTVVDMIELATGGSGKVNKEQALAAVKRGRPLGLLVGSGSRQMVFLVVKADGNMANERLANLANNKVGVVGKRKTKAGVHVIVADLIEKL